MSEPDQAEQISLFCAITGESVMTARQYLEAFSWDVETAVNTFHSAAHDTSASASVDEPAIPPDVDQEQIDAEMAKALSDSLNQRSSVSESTPRASGGGHAAPAIDSSDGIRAPMSSFKDRLVSRSPPFMARPQVDDVSEEEWMFPLTKIKPINCPGDIVYARQQAKESKKWLLVNLQSLENFQSHELIRDTWSSDIVQSIVQSAFVFWFRSSSCDQGRNFLRLYQIPEEHLPLVGIIGPTGSLLYSQSGHIPPEELATTLVEFLDSNTLNSTTPPKIRHRARSRTSSGPESRSEDEDQELAKALAMSEAKTEELAEDLAATSISHTLETPYLPDNYKEALTPEPDKGTPNTTRIQLRLADGKTIVRRFFSDDRVASLYAVVCEHLEEASHRRFILQTPLASLSLLDYAQSSLKDQSLTNSKVIMSWRDNEQ